MFLRPVESRFGTRAPSVEKVVEVTKARRGEIIASGGAAAASQLGLTTQLPVRQVYLTSGPFRESILASKFWSSSMHRVRSIRWQTVVQVRSCARLIGSVPRLHDKPCGPAVKD